jgi:uncharacterized membrane protein
VGVSPHRAARADWCVLLRGTNRLVTPNERRIDLIGLGLVLLILGLLLGVNILWTIGIILLVVGVILAVLGSMDRAVGGRRHYY